MINLNHFSKKQLIEEYQKLKCEIDTLQKRNNKKKSKANAKNIDIEFLNIAFDHSPDIVLIVRLHDGYFIKANQKFSEITGYTPDDYNGKTTIDLNFWVNPTDRQLFIDRLTLDGFCENFESVFRKKDGSHIHVIIFAQIAQMNGIQYIISNSHDNTFLKAAKNALYESEQKYQFIVENSDDIHWTMDGNFRLEYVSPSVYKFLGYTIEEHLNHSLHDFLTPNSITQIEDGFHYGMMLIQKKEFSKLKNSVNIEVEFIRKDKSTGFARISMTIMRDENYRILKIRGTTTDITDLKQLELKLQQQNTELYELISTKDKFFSIISHDLKNPFNAIIGLSELLCRNAARYDVEKILKFSESINNSTKETYKLLENLLDWSKIQRDMLHPNFQTYKLRNIVDEIILFNTEVAFNKDIHIHNRVFADTLVYCDEDMTKTILRNLLSNALKFTNKKGIVTISDKVNTDFVEIIVNDSGIGIPETTIPYLFKIEKSISTSGTANEKGTGLGLILCKELVEKQTGRIWADSCLGKGSTFCFTLVAGKY